MFIWENKSFPFLTNDNFNRISFCLVYKLHKKWLFNLVHLGHFFQFEVSFYSIVPKTKNWNMEVLTFTFPYKITSITLIFQGVQDRNEEIIESIGLLITLLIRHYRIKQFALKKSQQCLNSPEFSHFVSTNANWDCLERNIIVVYL